MDKTITIAPHSTHPLTVNRLGYGTMRLPVPNVWGEPADRPQALEILRTAVDSGVNSDLAPNGKTRFLSSPIFSRAIA